MSYEVIWGPLAEGQLAAVWLAATNRRAVTAAAAEVDRGLARDPLRAGEARESSVRRVVVVPPLGVAFEVIEDDKRVIVQGVWAVGQA